jgi:protein O-GlcNAc transferase
MAKKTKKIMRAGGKAGRRRNQKHAQGRAGASSNNSALQQALAFHQAGRLSEAEALYKQILQAEPKQPNALLYLGVLAHEVGKSGIAVELISRAVASKPDYFEAYYNLGIVFLVQGKAAEAAAAFRQALALKPDYVMAHNNLGNALLTLGKLEEAAASYQKALTLKPDFAEAHYNLGNALQDLGKPEEAEASYRKVLALKPDYVEADFNLGILLQAQSRPEEAAVAFREALSLKPDFVEAHNNLGIVLQALDKPDEAAASYRRALTLRPDYAEAYNNLGNALQAQGKLEEAVASFRQALTLKPDYAAALSNLGIALKDQDKLDEAVVSFRQALNLKPDNPEVHYNLGIIGKTRGNLDEAAANYRRALALKPDYVEAHSNLGSILKDQGKLAEAIASFRRALALEPDYAVAHSNLLFCLNCLPDQSVSPYLEEARNFGRKATAKVRKRYSGWRCISGSKPERLCVGLISGDFQNHPVGYFLENLLENIDLNRIDLVAYPTNFEEDELTERIRPRFIAWKPIPNLDDAAAARLIHDDGVNVLFDLCGHTRHNRLPVFAWKPAPVQVSWLGYSASTGMAEMDYLLADPYVAPPGEENHFSETIWRLPESYLCFSPPRETIAVAPLPALKEGHITFGCFNNPTKMTDAVVALWATVLHAVPRSRLLLKSEQFSDPAFCESTRRRFAPFGITTKRLLLEGFVLHREEHLLAYNRVDIALDPFPYNGTTTSVEGLWMGVPFITRLGDRFLSHVGESIARNTGLADWIASDDEHYITKAVTHSTDLEKLAGFRAGLRQQVLASPLFDGPRFARNFETAIWGMWRRFRKD